MRGRALLVARRRAARDTPPYRAIDISPIRAPLLVGRTERSRRKGLHQGEGSLPSITRRLLARRGACVVAVLLAASQLVAQPTQARAAGSGVTNAYDENGRLLATTDASGDTA